MTNPDAFVYKVALEKVIDGDTVRLKTIDLKTTTQNKRKRTWLTC